MRNLRASDQTTRTKSESFVSCCLQLSSLLLGFSLGCLPPLVRWLASLSCPCLSKAMADDDDDEDTGEGVKSIEPDPRTTSEGR